MKPAQAVWTYRVILEDIPDMNALIIREDPLGNNILYSKGHPKGYIPKLHAHIPLKIYQEPDKDSTQFNKILRKHNQTTLPALLQLLSEENTLAIEVQLDPEYEDFNKLSEFDYARERGYIKPPYLESNY
ncbi:MAG: hypothetical protein ACMXYK_00445 [Candidatus Woesearchaeota archaeon]